ncbi:FAD-dependent oxidoreductase [Tropicibacter oceani]|uniref:FAD-dependent oxidoreductase n=1 Tax=Tropicibacter oceani TaxID=3058420 RepID=A0ABY8QFE4_9RHOB|nr:FAD-dependent oxidoreductase [Tropicibacter oceani]WGW03329.1 FAD-dependent oxidoreductase [Tropicibacter oceani]
MPQATPVIILGAGLAGCCAALDLAQAGQSVTLIDRTPRPMMGASRHNEGKLHLGYVYAADPQLETHRLLAAGSLRFQDTVARLTRTPLAMQITSGCFNYIVPQDSARPVAALWDYVQTVDRTNAALAAEFGQAPLPPSRIADSGAISAFYAPGIQAVFTTPEIAVDPGRIADIVSAAVYADPLITFCGNSTVLGAGQTGSGGYAIDLAQGDDRVTIGADRVINALWEDRVRLDAMVGQDTPFVWSQRWKATVVIDVPPGALDLPSTTGFVGPYGDFVLYGDRRVYASWYPALRLSMSTTASPEEVRAQVAQSDPETLRRQALQGLATLMPGVAALQDQAARSRIGGGFIMAVGNTDIDDRASGLHERHQIGVEGSGRWLSISTGKFCTAPMFGVQAARMMIDEGAP